MTDTLKTVLDHIEQHADYDTLRAALLELGRQLAADPTCQQLEVGDPPRPLTNVEMSALLAWHDHQLQELIKRDGCCGGQITADGRCPENYFPCPLYRAARRIERQTFHASTLMEDTR